MQSQAKYLEEEELIMQNEHIQDYLKLKIQPIFGDLNKKFIREYNLLQGEVGLPLKHEANLGKLA